MRYWGYYRSSAAYRCRIAFNLKDVTIEGVAVELREGEQKGEAFRAINPLGLVPVLQEGDLTLTQSLAIIEWLDEAVPEPPLLPADRDRKAQVRAFAYTIAADIHPLQNLRVLTYLRENFDADGEAVEAWCQRWLGDGLAACESQLARAGWRGPFAFGGAPSLADICLVPQLYSAARFHVPLEGMPRLRAIGEACAAHPAFAEAHPSRQSDAPASGSGA